jgi:hypothetical protein
MATQNVSLTPDWLKVADAADDPVLIQAGANFEYQIAAVSVDGDPTVLGHLLRGPIRGISRSMIGPGHLYARISYGDGPGILIISGSSLILE